MLAERRSPGSNGAFPCPSVAGAALSSRQEKRIRYGWKALVLALIVVLLAVAGLTAASPPSEAVTTSASTSSEIRCPSLRRGLVYYRLRWASWRNLAGHGYADTNRVKTLPIPRGCAHVKWAAKQWFVKSVQARASFRQWKVSQTYVREQRTWKAAALYVQRFYPNTYRWLMSCSSTEGGHGKWVPNRDGYPPGGWMQMHESTFNRFMHDGWYSGGRWYKSAVQDMLSRGYVIRDESVKSWYSPVGQALSSAYAVSNGRIGEWDSTGCYERYP